MFLGSLWMTSRLYWSDKYNTARGLVVSDFEWPGGGRYDVIRQHMTTPCYLLRLLIFLSVWNHSLIIHIWYWILISNLYLTFDNQEQLPIFKISSDFRAWLLWFHEYTFWILQLDPTTISMKIGILRWILMKPQYDICSFYFFLDNVCFQTTVQKSLAEDCFLR